MPKPPFLVPSDAAEQQLPSLPDVRALCPISEPSHSAKESHFGDLHLQSCSFIMTRGEQSTLVRLRTMVLDCADPYKYQCYLKANPDQTFQTTNNLQHATMCIRLQWNRPAAVRFTTRLLQPHANCINGCGATCCEELNSARALVFLIFVILLA